MDTLRYDPAMQFLLHDRIIKNRIAHITKELKQLKQKVDWLYKILKPYSELLLKYKIDLTGKFTSQSVTIYIEKITDELLDKVNIDPGLFKSYLTAFMQNRRKIEAYLRARNKVKSEIFPSYPYMEILKIFNQEMGKKILNGYIWTLGFSLGRICVVNKKYTFPVDRPHFSKLHKKRLDMKPSLANKKALIQQGIKPYHRTHNPEGAKWQVIIETPPSDFSTTLYWSKVGSIREVTKYRLKSYTYHTAEALRDISNPFVPKTVNEILEKSYSFGQKLACIKKYFPEHRLVYMTKS